MLLHHKIFNNDSVQVVHNRRPHNHNVGVGTRVGVGVRVGVGARVRVGGGVCVGVGAISSGNRI